MNAPPEPPDQSPPDAEAPHAQAQASTGDRDQSAGSTTTESQPANGAGDSASISREAVEIVPDGADQHKSLRLVGVAAERRWPTDPRVKAAITAKVARITLQTDDERRALIGAKTYAQFEAQNQADDHKAEPDKLDVTLSTPMTAAAQREALLRTLMAERAKREGRDQPPALADSSAATNGDGSNDEPPEDKPRRKRRRRRRRKRS